MLDDVRRDVRPMSSFFMGIPHMAGPGCWTTVVVQVQKTCRMLSVADRPKGPARSPLNKECCRASHAPNFLQALADPSDAALRRGAARLRLQ